MPIYRVPVTYTSWGYSDLKAKNEEDLLNKLQSNDLADVPLPADPEYVDDSLEVDFGALDTDNIIAD